MVQPKSYRACSECNADLSVSWHRIKCSKFFPLPDSLDNSDTNPLLTLLPEIICVACGDTGLNSRGHKCTPCLMQGRIK